MNAREPLAPGDAIRLRATLSPPAVPALPGAYDFSRTAFFQGIGGVGYTLSRPEADPSIGEAPLVLRASAVVANVRQGISRRVREALPGERGALADALITGERGGISEATNAAYRDSGLFHILSISGLHMTVMAGTVFLALRLALSAFPGVALRLEVKKVAAVVATLVALGYLLISGGAFATVRAWVMITIMFVAIVLDRPAIALRNVALSALVILAFLPESLLDVGFQMSFAAVVSLVAAYEAYGRWRGSVAERGARPGPVGGVVLFLGAIVVTTLIASAAVAPFAAYHFHKSQQYAVLANLIAIPVCNLVVMPAVLATFLAMPFGLEALPLWVMGLGLDVMGWVAVKVAALPGAVGRIAAIPQAAFLAMALGGLWLCIWQTRWRLLGLIGVALGIAIAPLQARPDVLVGRNGQVMAVRGEDGRLAAVGVRSTWFELGRWLEQDGDTRTAREVAQDQRGMRCDAAACVAQVKGAQIALVRRPAALPEECERSALIVMTMPRPEACRTKAVAIDLHALRDEGTHAIFMTGDGVRVVSVGQSRGDRPWTFSQGAWGAETRRVAGQAGGRPTSRLGMFAAPYDLSGDDARRRPEIEDEDDPDEMLR
jgi:competence protein ComEC